MFSLLSSLGSLVAVAATPSFFALSLSSPQGWSWTYTGSESLQATSPSGQTLTLSLTRREYLNPPVKKLQIRQVPSEAREIRGVLFACRKHDGPRVCRRVPVQWLGPFQPAQNLIVEPFL